MTTKIKTKGCKTDVLSNANHRKISVKVFYPEKSNQYNTILEEWLHSKQIAVKESTYARYSRLINYYIRPEFGD